MNETIAAAMLTASLISPGALRRLPAPSEVPPVSGTRITANTSGLTIHEARARRRNPPSRPTRPPTPPEFGPAADDAQWKPFTDLVTARPTLTQTVEVTGNLYDVFIRFAEKAVDGQKCPAGTTPRNAAYVSKPRGAGGDVYPVRLSSFCLNLTSPGDFFNLNAELSGNVFDVEVYNNAKSFDPALKSDPSSAADRAAVRAHVSKMIALLSAN